MNEHINKWSISSWEQHKELVKNSMWLECALLAHENPDKVYIAPTLSYGMRLEVNRGDITQILPLEQTQIDNGVSYKLTKVFLKKDALVKRISFHAASALHDYLTEVRAFAIWHDQLVSHPAYTDIPTWPYPLSKPLPPSVIAGTEGQPMVPTTKTQPPPPPPPSPRDPPCVNIRG